jgi:hypothetical protein
MPPSLREALESATTEAEATAAAAPESTPAAAAPESTPAVSSQSLEAASDVSTDAPPPAEKPSAEKPPTEAAPAAPAEKAAAVPADKQTPEQKAEVARQARMDRAPQSWKREAKGEWAALPLQARQEIHRREMEIDLALKQSAPDRQLAEQFKQTLQPYMQRIQNSGFDPISAAKNLFEVDHILSSAPQHQRAEYMAELIIQYGIDINALDGALAPRVNGRPQGPTPAGSPQDIAALVQQQLQQALAPILQREEQAKQQQAQAVVSEVEGMGSDPRFPHFEEVRVDMGDIIRANASRGVYLTLEEAYSRAVRMNPDTYSQIERQDTMSSAQAAHQAAMKAKAAASSVSGAPAGGGGQFNSGDGSLRGAIEAAFGGQRL